MQIALGIDASDWKDLHLASSDAWAKGVEIFERRTRGRITDAVDLLVSDDELKSPQERRWGFAILAIDCLLVETLEAFRQALTDTQRKSKDLSVAFLTRRPAFKSFFTPDLATRFYYEFRCGVAHNAQVFGTGRVWSIGPLLAVDGSRIRVNRTAFHQALMTTLKEYVDDLRSGLEAHVASELQDQNGLRRGGQVSIAAR